MPAFNLEHEQRRLKEPGISYVAKTVSVRDSLRTLVAERTETPSFFELKLEGQQVTSTGYEHRGDLTVSFAKSEQEAPTEKIATRYLLENKGYVEAKDMFTKLPLHSTVMLLSPPPDDPIPGYPGHSFVYFYHILPGETDEQRTVKALAFVNRFSKEDQAQILNRFNPRQEVLPTEKSILSSPVSIAGGNETESFQTFWDSIRQFHKKGGYDFVCPPGLIMEEYLLHGERLMRANHTDLDIMISDLARRLAEGANVENIADDFNTMLKRGDKDFWLKDWGHQQTVQMNVPLTLDRLPQAAYIFSQNRSSEKVRQVMTFCGVSGGMKPNGEAAVNTWTFNVKTDNKQNQTKETILCCTCPFCGKEVDAKIEGGRIYCPNPECQKSAPYSKSN